MYSYIFCINSYVYVSLFFCICLALFSRSFTSLIIIHVIYFIGRSLYIRYSVNVSQYMYNGS